MAKKKPADNRVAVQNRKARHDYSIEDTVEAGMVLTGSEVKSLRLGRANIAESYATEKEGEIFLVNAHINGYAQAGPQNHDPKRIRKLLLNRREIDRLGAAVQRDGMTLVPLKIFFNDRGIAKLELGLAKGKRQFEKREAIKQRDWDRQKARVLRDHG
jgi:SsrA-binding protein